MMASQQTLDEVQSMYLAYYGRAADPGGLAYWAARVELDGGSLAGGWRSLESIERAQAREVFARLNELTGLRLHEVADRPADSGGSIRLNANGTSNGGFAYYPGASALAGDIFLNRNGLEQGYFIDDYSYGRLVLLHEAGHALGLEQFAGILIKCMQCSPIWRD